MLITFQQELIMSDCNYTFVNIYVILRIKIIEIIDNLSNLHSLKI